MVGDVDALDADAERMIGGVKDRARRGCSEIGLLYPSGNGEFKFAATSRLSVRASTARRPSQLPFPNGEIG